MSAEVSQQFFPMVLQSGITGELVNRADKANEIRELNAQIFSRPQLRLFNEPPEREATVQRLRQAYAPSHPECIVFYNDKHLPIGWFYSYRDDVASAYIDTVGFLPTYQGRGLYSAFLPKYLAYARLLELERVVTSHHPNNRAIMIVELKLGFNIVGLELHESSGPLIKMAYFMHADRQDGFREAFNMAPDPSANFKK
jgi:RimJ/RimL family protein N-acetyltransferase